VISTLMLNFVATGLGAYLLATYLRAGGAARDTATTGLIPPSGRMPSLNGALRRLGIDLPPGSHLYGFLAFAVAAGFGYHVLIRRTRFGFDLRALGVNLEAARVSGADPAGMAVRALLLSGALAGLVGMAPLLGSAYLYSNDFPTGLGFTGIAVALVGRKHPVGMALAAVLYGFLERSAQILDLLGIPREIVLILEGAILLSAVIAYELTRRIAEAGERRLAAGATAGALDGGSRWPPG
jgi:simple sugar transport system permease protein